MFCKNPNKRPHKRGRKEKCYENERDYEYVEEIQDFTTTVSKIL